MFRKKSGVYKIVNTKTGKIYIGSSVDLKRRERVHFNSLKRGNHENSHLQNAYNKHGKDNFVFEVIEEINKEYNIEREQHWINQNSFNELYNINPTAGSFLGRTHSDETKLKIRLGNSNSRGVHQIDATTGDLIESFSSAREAERSTGIKSSKISPCCKGKQKSSGGYKWRFTNESSSENKKWIACNGAPHGLSKRVCQIDRESNSIIDTFPSSMEAERVTGVANQSISKCCTGKRNTAGGYKWEYVY